MCRRLGAPLTPPVSFISLKTISAVSSALAAVALLATLSAKPVFGQTTIALVQHASKDAGIGTTASQTFPSPNVAGNWIAVIVRSGVSGQSFTVTDSSGNTYKQAVKLDITVDTPSGDTLALFYAENIRSGANAVSVRVPASATLRLAILEYRGVALTNSLDVIAAAQGSGATPSSGNATTTTAGELAIGAVATANGRTFTAGSGYVTDELVPGAPNTKLFVEHQFKSTVGTVAATASLNAADAWGSVLATFRPGGQQTGGADPTLSKTHVGTFTQGQTGATYTLTVTNSGTAATSGTVTVTDTLPAGLSATSLSGASWSCTLSTLTCTRSDGLAAGSSYAPITLTVNVAASAPSTVTNSATVSGGSDTNTGNNSATDATIVGSSNDTQPPTPPGSLTATGSGNQISLNWSASTDNTAVTTYLIEQCQGTGCTTFSQIGSIGGAAGSSITAPLSASANPNYFKDGSGATIALNGSHSWNTLQDWGPNGSQQVVDFQAFVNFLVAHGQNFTLLWRTELPKFCGLPTTASSPPDLTVGPHPWQRTGPGTATDGKLKFDLSKFDQTYFDRLRTRVQALKNANIYAGIYLFTGEWLEDFRCASDGYPFTGANNVNGVDDGGGVGSITMTAPNSITAFQDAYVEKVIDTLNDLPNVLWITSEEAPSDSTWWNSHQISHIRAYESGKPYQHPIGYGVLSNNDDSILINSNADWIAPAARLSTTTSCGSGTPRCKVNINDSDHSYFGMWTDFAQANRDYAWENFLNGNQVVFMDPYLVYYPRENRNLCGSPNNAICATPDARWNNFRDNLGYITRYSRKINLAAVTVRGSLSSTGLCLAQTPSVGAEYLIYAPFGGSFTVNLSAMSSSRTLKVEWFNPASGVTIAGAAIPAGSSSQSFTPPFTGDAVLYLVDSAGHAGSAPSTSYVVTGLAAGTYSYRVRAMDGAGNLSPYSNVASATVSNPATPDLTLTKTHAGSFAQGQTGATYSLTARNSGTTATVGTVTVSDTLPAGLTAASMNGTGWNCTQPAGPCTRADSLAAGASYPSITLTVTVANNASSSVTNTAIVSGGGQSNTTNDNASDVTTITTTTATSISLVQHAGKDAGTATSSTLAFPSANTAGNWLAVAIRAGNTGQTFTVTDTRANTYRRAVQLNDTGDQTTVAIFYAESIAGGANTVTVSDSLAGGTLRFAIFEYAGVAATNSLDGVAAAQGTGTVPNSGSATSTMSGELVIGMISTANPTIFTAGNNFIIEEQVPASPNAKLIVEDRILTTAGSVAAGGSLASSDVWSASVATFRPRTGGTQTSADLTLTKSHSGAFAQGQVGARYTIIVSNAGAGATNGSVTLTDTLPSGLTATAITGSGWACQQPVGPCTRSDALAAGASYPAVTLTVNVAAAAPTSVTNVATVSGGGETNTGNDTAQDATPITTTTALSVYPRTAVVTSTQKQSFVVSGGGVGSVSWLVDGVVGGTSATGTITSNGVYSPPSGQGTHTVTATTSDQLQSASATVYVTNYRGTFTRDVDNLRTGVNTNETVLTPANVNVNQFGKLFSYPIDGVSDASPLYVANVNIPGIGLRNVVYVATEHDSVYAFDADGLQSTPLWKVSFIDPSRGITTVPPDDTGEPRDIYPEIGITGSPVIDPATNTLYVVAKTKEVSGQTTYVHRLHALDLATGAEKLGGPVVIQASVNGTGDGSTGSQVPFISLRENQRAALLLSNGVVYIAFAGHGDQPPYHGWLFGYSAGTLQRVMVYNTTPNGEGGGIWQSGDGPATDASGNIFFVTGDGTFDANTGGRDFGDSFLKLSPTGTVLDYFTPHDQAYMNAYDIDLGSGGTTLLPDQPGTYPHIAVSAGKNGTIYVVNRDNLGHYNSSNDNQIVQSLVNVFPNGSFITGNFKAPMYWNSRLFYSADADYIKSFQLTNGRLSTSPTSQSSFILNYPGATLGMSSNGNTNGILWAIQRVDLDPLGQSGTRGPGVLHAFDATNLNIHLYDSTEASGNRDTLDYAAKWAAPLVANGKVFVATNGRLTVFGLLP